MFIFALFLIWRIGLFAVAQLGVGLLPFSPRFPYADMLLIPSGLPAWFWSFANFDGVHYLTIAKGGYSAQYTQVFFPLYPLVLRFIHSLIFFVNPVFTGIIFSSLLFLAVLFIFQRLLLLDYKKDEIKWMILFFVFFPTSFFLGSLYTEGIFLLFIFSAFYTARKKHFRLAAVLGALASATRLVGIFLIPALWWEEIIAKRGKIGRKGSKTNKLETKYTRYFNDVISYLNYIVHSPITYILPIGLLAYMIFLQWKYGDFLYFWHAQPVFGAQRSGAGIILLPQVIWRYFKIFSNLNPLTEPFVIAFTEFVATILSIILLVTSYLKKIRLSYLIFSLLTILVPTLTGTFSSMPRYILVAFPLFIVLGLIKNKWVKIALLIIFIVLLSFYTVLFTRGHWVS